MATQGKETRRKHLQILLDRLTGHADIIRQHLKERPHPYTLGFAAEAGVRDVLRQVLPRRLAVTSGFIRTTRGRLLTPPTTAQISPQTDIIVYDTLRACPLYSVEGIDVVAAPDVLAVLEVKDSGSGEGDLGITKPGFEARKRKAEATKAVATAEDDGALEQIIDLAHITELGVEAPGAFRGVVLIQGDSAKAARDRLEFAQSEKNMSPKTAPHVIYGRALERGDSYVAFLESADDSVHFNAYARHLGGETDAFAVFLRLITGYFAAQGLTSASISTDLYPSGQRTMASPQPLRLATGDAPASLRDAFRRRPDGAAGGPYPSDQESLKEFFVSKKNKGLKIHAYPTIGHDVDKTPTSGSRVTVRYLEVDGLKTLSSLFTMSTGGDLRCVDSTEGGGEDVKPWRIHQEAIEAHLMRVCNLDATIFIPEEEEEFKDMPVSLPASVEEAEEDILKEPLTGNVD